MKEIFTPYKITENENSITASCELTKFMKDAMRDKNLIAETAIIKSLSNESLKDIIEKAQNELLIRNIK